MIRKVLQNNKVLIVLVYPATLLATMYIAFQMLVSELGFHTGYLVAFTIYWIGWGFLFPILVLGGFKGILDLFKTQKGRTKEEEKKIQRPKHLRKAIILNILLWLPLIFPAIFTFTPRLADATIEIVLVSVGIGIAIGITEEILWRGVYIRKFPLSKFFGIIVPAIWFSIWHIAPQSVNPNPLPGGAISFLLYALMLGLSWGYVAWSKSTIRGVATAHIVHDSLGLAGFTFLNE